MKGVSKMPFTMKRVPLIGVDLKTGKVRPVVPDYTERNEPLKAASCVSANGKARGGLVFPGAD